MSAYGYSKVFNMQTNMHMCLIVPIRKGVRAYSYKINDIIIKIIIIYATLHAGVVVTPSVRPRYDSKIIFVLVSDGASYLKYYYFSIILNNNCINKYRCVFIGGGRVNIYVLTSLHRGQSAETHVGRREKIH